MKTAMGLVSKLNSWVVEGIAAAVLVSCTGCPGRLSEKEVRDFDTEIYQHNQRQSQRFGASGNVYRPTYAQDKKQ